MLVRVPWPLHWQAPYRVDHLNWRLSGILAVAHEYKTKLADPLSCIFLSVEMLDEERDTGRKEAA